MRRLWVHSHAKVEQFAMFANVLVAKEQYNRTFMTHADILDLFMDRRMGINDIIGAYAIIVRCVGAHRCNLFP